ncbi:MAG: caspase family protein [Verrucomicrobiales bacterium]|nr:caspase family protein [Verrucomicrobiales bacterium]
MPRGHSILVGVPFIDTEAPFYSRSLPGFDGRAGCEGVVKDIRRMEALAHYFGYRPVLGESLVGSKATVSNVLSAIDALASPSTGLDHGDHVLIYLSCHGRTMGSVAGEGTPSAGLSRALNAFLLHDGPFFNVTLFDRLRAVAAKSGRIRLRFCTVVDSCHAGSGNALPPGLLKELQRDVEDIWGRGLALPPAMIAQALSAAGLAPQAGGKASLFADLQLDPASIQITLKIALIVVQLLLAALAQLPVQMVHLGAVGDEFRAQGGSSGSLFTRLLDMAIREAERAYTYREMHAMLVDWLPEHRRPVLERPGLNTASPHFADRSTVFSIEE